MNNTLFIFLCLLSHNILFGQAIQVLNLNDDSLILNWEKIQLWRLPIQINSTSFETAPILHPSNRILFFSRKDYPYRGTRANIWYSIFDEEMQQWQEAQKLNELNNFCSNYIEGISSNGRFFLIPNTLSSCDGNYRIYELIGERFMNPVLQKIKKFYSLSGKQDISWSVNGEVLIFSIEQINSCGQQDLYVSFKQKKNKWCKPIHLGCNVNSDGDEITPFLMPDNKTLFFSSDGHPGYGGQDIFYSQRLDDTWQNWSEPVNLGRPINSSSWDAGFTFSLLYKKAYFVKMVARDDTDIMEIEFLDFRESETTK